MQTAALTLQVRVVLIAVSLSAVAVDCYCWTAARTPAYLRFSRALALSHIVTNAMGCCKAPLLPLPFSSCLLLLCCCLSVCLPNNCRTLSMTQCMSSGYSTFGTTSALGRRLAVRTAARSSAAKPLLTGLMRTANSASAMKYGSAGLQEQDRALRPLQMPLLSN